MNRSPSGKPVGGAGLRHPLPDPFWPPLQPRRAPGRPLNIVVLYADDWRHDKLGCAGNPVVRTPRLDQLAREGIRFKRNCVTTSICGVQPGDFLDRAVDVGHGNTAFGAFKTPWSEPGPPASRAGLLERALSASGTPVTSPPRTSTSACLRRPALFHQPDERPIHVTRKNEGRCVSTSCADAPPSGRFA